MLTIEIPIVKMTKATHRHTERISDEVETPSATGSDPITDTSSAKTVFSWRETANAAKQVFSKTARELSRLTTLYLSYVDPGSEIKEPPESWPVLMKPFDKAATD
jgi:hypothetical protein